MIARSLKEVRLCPVCGSKELEPRKRFCSLTCMGKSYQVDPILAFWAKVDKGPHPKGCWLWTGFLNHDGYGRVGPLKGVHTGKRAHRMMWEMHHGAVPDGQSVMHLCDVRACVRPDHLQLGSHQENIADMQAKERMASKLTVAAVKEMRARLSSYPVDKRLPSDVLDELEEKYGVCRKTIWAVHRRRKWQHVI